jgi:Pyruvate/2-oxoacid:ferredoxin oxidoreductase delta subunit
MTVSRKIIEIDEDKCNGCGQCASACAEGAITIVDEKARVVKDSYCDGLGACIGECPRGALTIVEREADAFDPEAVQHHLRDTEPAITTGMKPTTATTLPCGCPSSNVQIFASPCETANRPGAGSALSHWPVQIKLVPPTAPFLHKADLLVASDCTPVAYPAFHADFLRGKVALIGCPKFDDTEEYISKFEAIFRTADIKSVTILVMEVPCCSKMPWIVDQGMVRAGKQLPLEVAVVGVRDGLVKREKYAA